MKHCEHVVGDAAGAGAGDTGGANVGATYVGVSDDSGPCECEKAGGALTVTAGAGRSSRGAPHSAQKRADAISSGAQRWPHSVQNILVTCVRFNQSVDSLLCELFKDGTCVLDARANFDVRRGDICRAVGVTGHYSSK